MYNSPIKTFLKQNPATILGDLVSLENGEVSTAQRDAWIKQIVILQKALDSIDGIICFEFPVPRLGKRVDNVLLVGKAIIAIEFKVGAKKYDRSGYVQVEDYALDLMNFHKGSHHHLIAPVLVATDAPTCNNNIRKSRGSLFAVSYANSNTLGSIIKNIASICEQDEHILSVDHNTWLQSSYSPTPTIIDAAKALYSGHGVEAITRSEAGVDNLHATQKTLSELIHFAETNQKKVICFVSGVPGAGKTLAGLNLVCLHGSGTLLSGNGPLVSVLREALVRDHKERLGIHKKEAERKVNAFIQNIHHFRDDYLPTKNSNAPVEHIVVFDEAQRAWDREQTSKFMTKKRGQVGFNQSEPEYLISVMDRHQDWAVIVCLIGGGQEINTGEAGLEEWLVTLQTHFRDWQVYLPNAENITHYLPTFQLDSLKERLIHKPALHLGVSLRSFRAEELSSSIAALLTGDPEIARDALISVLPKFPIRITRSLTKAKEWVRKQALGSERYGILASSGGKRLKPLGINMNDEINPCNWFLNGPQDIRSSLHLEDAANEFVVQGLELDWTLVVWDADLVHKVNTWRYRNFRGTRWEKVRSFRDQQYLINTYRVLLTRARQGMIIVIPQGDSADPTRSPDLYDSTWEYFVNSGLPILN